MPDYQQLLTLNNGQIRDFTVINEPNREGSGCVCAVIQRTSEQNHFHLVVSYNKYYLHYRFNLLTSLSMSITFTYSVKCTFPAVVWSTLVCCSSSHMTLEATSSGGKCPKLTKLLWNLLWRLRDKLRIFPRIPQIIYSSNKMAHVIR